MAEFLFQLCTVSSSLIFSSQQMIMKSISPLQLSSALIMVIFTKISTADESSSCVTNTDNSSLVTCFNVRMPDIPEDLEKKMEGLTISDCVIETITSQSFANYPDLNSLSFINTNVKRLHDRNFLMSLKKLETIMVAEKAKIPLFLSWSLPSTIKSIHFTGMEITNLELTDQDLPNLNAINLNSNKLRTFPVLKLTYPLEIIALDDNPDIVITVEDILPFCKLKHIVVSALVEKGSQFNERWTVCRCLRLKKFVEQEKLHTNFDEFLCENTKDENCSFVYDKKILKIREQCLPPTVPPSTATATATATAAAAPPVEGKNNWFMKVVLVILLLLLVMVVIGGIVFYFRKKRSNKPNENVNNDEDEPELEEESVLSENEEE